MVYHLACRKGLKSALIVSMHADDLFGSIPNTTSNQFSFIFFFILKLNIKFYIFRSTFSPCTVPPMVWIPQVGFSSETYICYNFFNQNNTKQIPHLHLQQLVGTPIGYNVTLECFIEAYPISLNYWSKDDSDMIHDSNKYKWVCIHFPLFV